MNEIIVRYPPSPTGLFHIGTARTVLYNYLFAKKNNGKAIMRMEDTDKNRSEKQFEENILSGIKKLGMSWGENWSGSTDEIEYQSKRTAIYTKYIAQLLAEDKAYYCFSTPEELNALREQAQKEKKAFRYPETWRDADKKLVQEKLNAGEKSVIRYKLPRDITEITFTDAVRGEVTIKLTELDDFVIAKNLETPLYNFCVVIDDNDMKISHVIRGEDHISNTPKQILLFKEFGFEIPTFAHLPLILNSDKSKLSKRKNNVSVDNYLEEGFLPEAIINFLALLGWNTSDEQEIFTMEELVEKFSLDRVHKAGAIFDIEKLKWINQEWIKKMDVTIFQEKMMQYWKTYNIDISKFEDDLNFLTQALVLVKDKTKQLSEVLNNLELFYTDDKTLEYSTDIYFHKKMKTSAETAKESLEFAKTVIENLDNDFEFTAENLKTVFIEKIKEAGFKNGYILYPLRVALSGSEFSPGTLELLEIFGKERSIVRINRGLELVS